MLKLATQALTVSMAYPPAKGRFTNWDWDGYFGAVLNILKNPNSLYEYSRSMNVMSNLPADMIFSEGVLTAAWARFNRLYVGFDKDAVYRVMKTLSQNSGRYNASDRTLWYAIEQEWQVLDKTNFDLWVVGGRERKNNLSDAVESTADIPMSPYVQKYHAAYISIISELEGQPAIKLESARQIYFNQMAKATDQELIDTYNAVINAINAKIITEKTKDQIKLYQPDFSNFSSDDYRQYYESRKLIVSQIFKKMMPNNSIMFVFAENDIPRFSVPAYIDGFFLPPSNDNPIVEINTNGFPNAITPGTHKISVSSIAYEKYDLTIEVPGGGRNVQVIPLVLALKDKPKTAKLAQTNENKNMIANRVISQVVADLNMNPDDISQNAGKRNDFVEGVYGGMVDSLMKEMDFFIMAQPGLTDKIKTTLGKIFDVIFMGLPYTPTATVPATTITATTSLPAQTQTATITESAERKQVLEAGIDQELSARKMEVKPVRAWYFDDSAYAQLVYYVRERANKLLSGKYTAFTDREVASALMDRYYFPKSLYSVTTPINPYR